MLDQLTHSMRPFDWRASTQRSLRVAQVRTAVLRWIDEAHLPTKRQASPLSAILWIETAMEV